MSFGHRGTSAVGAESAMNPGPFILSPVFLSAKAPISVFKQSISNFRNHFIPIFKFMSDSRKPMTPDVEALQSFQPRGTLIPHTWWRRICFKNGKPDTVACLILSEILYWYRPSQKIVGGQVVGLYRKFNGDILQKSYQELADKFGFTKRMVQEAVYRLNAKNLIKTELRTVKVGSTICSSVTFFRLNVNTVKEISEFKKEDETGDLDGEEASPSHSNVRPITTDENGSHFNVPPPPSQGEPYTEITTEMVREKEADSFSEKRSVGADAKTEKTVSVPVVTIADSVGKQCLALLENVFMGKPVTGPVKKKFLRLVAKGAITPTWMKALHYTSKMYHQKPDWYKNHDIKFVPFTPAYLVEHPDMTNKSIEDIVICELNIVQSLLLEHDPVWCAQVLDASIKAMAYWGKPVEQIKPADVQECMPGKMPVDEIPAWIRMVAAARGDKLTPSALAMAPKALQELSCDPTVLKAPEINLEDAEITGLFAKDYSTLVAHASVEEEKLNSKQELLSGYMEATAVYSFAFSEDRQPEGIAPMP